MYKNEEGYLKLLEKILREGQYRKPVDEDGRKELFGEVLKFDLTNNKLPLYTTKRVFFKSLAGELIWFLSGSQKTDLLKEMGIGIWKTWENEEGVVGPLYPSLLIDWRTDQSILLPIEPKIKEYKPPIPPQDRMVAEPQESIDGVTYQSNKSGQFIIIADEGTSGEHSRRYYTIQFLETGFIKQGVLKQTIESGEVKDFYYPLVENIGYCGEIKNPTKIDSALRKIWEGVLARCYNPADKSYKYYGGKGVFVDPEWLNFAIFQRDVQKISGWCRKLDMPELYQLDKDYYGSNCYSKDTCVWLSNHDNALYKTQKGKAFSATHDDGRHIPKYLNTQRFATEFGLWRQNIGACLRGKIAKYKGWTFKYLDDGKIYRPSLPINQIEKVMKSLRDRPEARSHIVTMLRPDVEVLQSIKTCHVLLQFYRNGDELSSSLYIRSQDYMAGNPYNVAQYSLLTHMIAEQLGIKAKEFTLTIGDCHVYESHFKQAEEQLTKPILATPTIRIKRIPESIFDYTLDDFEVVGYAHSDYLPLEISPQGTPGQGSYLV